MEQPPARAGGERRSARSTRSACRSTGEVADAAAQDVDDVVLGAAGIHVAIGSLELLGELVPGEGAGRARRRCARRRHPRLERAARARPAALVDARDREQVGRGPRLLWRSLRLERSGLIVASAAGRPPTSPGSPPRPTCAGSTGSPVPTSAGRPGRRGDRRQDGDRPARRRRTSSARSTGPRGR